MANDNLRNLLVEWNRAKEIANGDQLIAVIHTYAASEADPAMFAGAMSEAFDLTTKGNDEDRAESYAAGVEFAIESIRGAFNLGPCPDLDAAIVALREIAKRG